MFYNLTAYIYQVRHVETRRFSVAVLLLTIASLFSSPPDFRPQFINVAVAAGLTFKHKNGASSEKHLVRDLWIGCGLHRL